MTSGLSTDRLVVTGFWLSTLDTPKHRRLLWFGLTVAGILLWLPYILANPTAIDAHAYYVGEYGVTWGTTDSYVYSPAFAQALEPLRWLGWDGFRTAWRALNVAVLAILTGPFTGPLLFARPVALEVNLGNIHILMGAAIAAGFRWPAMWAFILLTKITPGVGLLWFAVRREWRQLGIALGATLAIVAVSFAIDPAAWVQWAGVLMAPNATDADLLITAPLSWRLAAAAVLVVWGARTDRPWTVLVAAFVALPAVWLAASAMLLGGLRHLEPRDRRLGVDDRRVAEGLGARPRRVVDVAEELHVVAVR